MQLSAQDIYQAILIRAADEWNVDFDDVEKDLAQRFDPIVRFMAGGLASELESAYQMLNATENRLQDRLAKLLLPEHYHLPRPAHALMTAKPEGGSLLLDERSGFLYEPPESEEDNLSFTPLFPTRLLPTELRVLATERNIVNLGGRGLRRRGGGAVEKEESRRILIGFAANKPILNWNGVSLHFDLRTGGASEGEQGQFFLSLQNCRVILGDEYEILPRHGFARTPADLESHLNGNERLYQRITNYYERHFLTFTDEEVPLTTTEMVSDRLTRWFNGEAPDDQDSRLAQNQVQPDEKLYWLEIQLGRSMDVHRLRERLRVNFNVFPVVNRRLHGHGKNEHYFMRKPTIKWVHLQPPEDFLAICRVYEDQGPAYPSFTFKPFADFKEDNSPSYTVRHGGVGRWDEFNTWKRLAYVVAILQENYAHNELIQKAADSLSLEEIHHLLGKKISAVNHKEKPTRDIYILLHSGSRQNVRTRVEYWTSAGEAANGLATKTSLRGVGREAGSLTKEDAYLFTTTTGGRSPLARTEQLQALKSNILSRGRIVTREDAKAFCQDSLREKLRDVIIRDGVGHDHRYNFGMTRVLDVVLWPARGTEQEDWNSICYQLERELESRSTSNIPIRVLTEHVNPKAG